MSKCYTIQTLSKRQEMPRVLLEITHTQFEIEKDGEYYKIIVRNGDRIWEYVGNLLED